MPRLLALAGLAAAIVAAGCGGESTVTVTESATETQDAEASRRVVIEAQDGAFDSRTIYENAAPGVVIVVSIFGGADTADILGGGGGGAGQGSGFVISGEGEILTNAHVVTDASTTGVQTEDLNEARAVFV